MLNDDCLRIVVKHAALLAEADFKPQQLSLEDPTLNRFAFRTPHLQALSLVDRQWREAAQLELESVVLVTPTNYAAILRAMNERKIGRRVRTLIADRDWCRVDTDPRALDPILEACEHLEELFCDGFRMSFNSLVRMKSLARLSLMNVAFYGGAPNVVMPGRLTHLVLHNTGFEMADFNTLVRACQGSLEFFQPRGIHPSQLFAFHAILDAACGTLRTLDLHLFSVQASILRPFARPNLSFSQFKHFSRLETLRIFSDEFSTALDSLSLSTSAPSLRSLALHRRPGPSGAGGDADVWEEPLTALLAALQAPVLSKLESLDIDMMRAWFDRANGGVDSTPLYEVKEAAKARGIAVKVT
ncbi:hypothetical protein JCM6882_000989 [Rhodosporidiobolus microsporus]